MTYTVFAAGLHVLLALVFGVLVPWRAMRALVPALNGGPLETTNYRGRRVSATLGVAWVLWAAGLVVTKAVLSALLALGLGSRSSSLVLESLVTTPFAMPFFALPFLLVMGSFAVGLFDDAFGSHDAKGFRGHFAALRHGHLTTGMLKLLGVGALALAYGSFAAQGVLERSGVTIIATDARAYGWLYILAWFAGAATIAFAANLMNLLDCRPGRALKVYSVCVIVPAVLYVLENAGAFSNATNAAAGSFWVSGMAGWGTALAAVIFVLTVLGPVIAVWSFDVGERAMLGDGGANAMGALLGFLLASSLPLVWLIAAAVVLAALNLLSERVSFSAIIEKTPLLAFLDGLGREKSGERKQAADAGQLKQDPGKNPGSHSGRSN